MAEDREDGSPGDEAEQYEVLDEVGEVEGWDGEFPDDDEQDLEDEDVQVVEIEEKAVSDLVPQSNKKQETVATEDEPVCVKPSSVEKNNSISADKENKEQSQASLNKESSPNKDVKFTESSNTKDVMLESAAIICVKLEPSESKEVNAVSSVSKNIKVETPSSKEVQSNEATASNDVILIDSCASEDVMAKRASASKVVKSKESSTSTDAKSKESSTITDAKSKESYTSTDAKSKESSTSTDAKSKESSTSTDAKSKESSTSTDAKSKESSTGTDAKSKESSTSTDAKSKASSTSTEAKSKESSTSKDAKSKESSSSKDAKSKESSSSKDAKSKESASSKDAKSKESASSKDAKSKESASSKDAKSKESSSSKDAKSKESSSSKDAKSKESASSKDAKSKESASSKDAKSKESASSKDAKSKESASSKDAKSKESASSKDAKSKESASSKDAKSKESASSKDVKSKESSASKEKTSGKDGKLNNQSSSGKDASSNSSSKQKVDKTAEDKKKTETKGSESQQKSTDSALKRTNDDPEVQGPKGKKMKLCIERLDYKKLKLVVEMVNSKKMKLTIKRLGDNELKIRKVQGEEEFNCCPEASCNMKGEGSAVKRKSDNPGAQKPEEKKMKLSSGKEDNKGRPSVEEIEVILSDSWKEHQINKKRFVMTMITLSEELKRARDYRRWAEKLRKDGMMFPVFNIDPPAEPILFSCCQLVSGYENDSTKLCLGIPRNLEVLRFSACETKYVPEVRSAVKAFEEMVRSCSKPLFDPITRQGYWHGVTLITNSKDKTILQVDLYAANEHEGGVRSAEAKDILLKHFSAKRAGLDCHISSIFLRLVFAKKNRGTEKVTSERMAARCIMGGRFIVETIGGVKVNLYPWSFFSTGTLAMTALCEEMLKVLLQERCETVVELGCGTGIVGQFLARHSVSVLGVDTAECIAEARVNADENHLKNCTYFDGRMKDVWATLGDVLRGKPSVMVIVNALNFDYLVDDPAVLEFLQRTEEVHRVVYVKCLDIFNENMLGFLCLPIKVVRLRPEDRLPYLPLYAAALDLGTETYTAIVVFQHVEKDFLKELYAERQNYWVQHICISPFKNQNTLASTDDAEGHLKSSCKTLPPTKTKLLEGNLSDQNLSKESVEISAIKDKDNIPVSKDNSNAGSTVDFKGGSREGSGSESVKRDVVVDRNGVNQVNIISGFGPQLLEDGITRKMSSSSLREEQKEDKCVPVMRLGEAPYRRRVQASSSRVVPARLRPPYTVHVIQLSSPPKEVQDVEADLPEKQVCAELAVLTDDDRANRLVQKVIGEDRNTKMVVPRFSTTFTEDIVPPGTEDSEPLLQEKGSKIDEDIDVQGVSGRDKTIGVVQGKTAGMVMIRNKSNKSSGNIRGNYKNLGHIRYKSPTQLPPVLEAWDGARHRWGMQDAAPSLDGKFYGSDVRHRPHFTGDTSEAFPLVKDGVQFDTRVDTDENRIATFEELRDMRYTSVNLRGSSSGRSFDDAELERRVRPRTDDVSGIKTNVRDLNIRTGGWYFRDDMRNIESIHDGFQNFDACKGSNLLEFKDLNQHTFALNDKSRPMMGDAEINRAMISMPEDRNRTVYERNTLCLGTESKRQMQQRVVVGEGTREKYGELYEHGSLHSAGINHSSWVNRESDSIPKKTLEKVHHIPVLNSRRLASGVKQSKTERKKMLASSQRNTYHPYGAVSAVQTLRTDFIPSGVDSHVDRTGLCDTALALINTSSQGRWESAQGPYDQNFVVAQPGTVHQSPHSWGVSSAPQLPFHADAHRSVALRVQNCAATPASFPGIIRATGGMVQTGDVCSYGSQWVSPLHRSDERVIQGW